MKKKFICLLMVTALLLTGCGKKIPKLKNGKEAIVTFENGDKISVDELYEKIKKTYGLDNMVTLIDKYVLAETFPKYKKKAEKYAKDQIDEMRKSYKSDEEMENLLMQFGFGTIENYQDTLYINYMKKYAEKQYAKKQITDKDIKNYYDDTYEADIKISQILIVPDVNDDTDTDTKIVKEDEAKAKAEKMIKKLKKAKKGKVEETFKTLAKENSDDEETKDKGGSLGRINKNILDDEYDEIVEKAYELKDGEFYTEVIKTELGYHVIMRNKTYKKSSLEDSKKNIKDILADNLMKDDTKLSAKAMQHYRKKLGMEITDEELQKQYANYMQNQLFEK